MIGTVNHSKLNAIPWYEVSKKGSPVKDWVGEPDGWVCSFENKTYGQFASIPRFRVANLFKVPVDTIAQVMILRDVRNLIASVMQLGLRDGKLDVAKVRQAAVLWKLHTRAYLNRAFGVEWVSYDKWVVGEEYRKAVASRLGLKYQDSTLSKVATGGRGSSFDGFEFDGRASEMKTLDRWRVFEHDAFYKRVVTKELLSLNERLQGALK
jgi:hypothetical protein